MLFSQGAPAVYGYYCHGLEANLSVRESNPNPLCRDDLHISNVDPATNIKFMYSKVIPTGDEHNYKRTLYLPIHHLERK